YDVRELRATHGTTALLSLNVSGGAELGAKPSFSAKGHLQADAAALMQQPVAASHASLARGNIDASFDAHVAATVQANASIHARNLVARQDNRPLGDASLEVTATVQPDGSSVLRIPLAMTNGTRKSDLLVDGKLARTGNSIRFDGRITSEQLVIDDLQPLASLVSGSTTPPSTGTRGPAQGATPPAASVSRAGVPPPSAVPSPTSVAAQSEALPRDTQPFWNGFGGAITLDLKQITYGSDYVIRNVTGSATASPTQLALAPLQGQFKDNAFKISGAIGFDSRKTQPYVLNASANIPNVDVGAILKAANPGQPPQLETKVTIAAKLDGKGGNLTELAQNIYGTFDASGSKGVLRALAGNVGRVSSGLSLAAGLIGAAQNSQGWDAAAGLTQKLSNLPFDRFAMHVERGADLNLKVSSIEFVTPDTHITGSGTVTNQPGVPITNQPMRFTLQLGGKGDMAVLLQRVGLLGNQRDNLGYSMMGTTFTLTGTPAKANPSDFWRIVGQAALRAAAGHFLGR
ncbi:MAG TPA: hypothetical protein VHE61_02670, partial [Opitutaceae bacterium]|nr:hypothetical protein [Opitutaceae bacterium]